MLHVKSFTFNPFQENTWILWSEKGNCLIIDPGFYTTEEKTTFKKFIDTNSLRPVRLINTHCHIDHVLGNPFVFATWGLKPEIHPQEQMLLDAVGQYGKMWGIESEPQPETIHSLEGGGIIELDNNRIDLFYTPGHSPGEISLYCGEDNFLIAGDVLFHEGIGRTDLPGGDYATLERSIRQLYRLPEHTAVHPGHGISTSIGHEKKNNPFVKDKN